MPRDMTGTGRYPPNPRHPPISFYSSVRLGDPELLAKIMDVDPYFVTQDNGAGAPLHFAVTYCQLDMVHHLLNNGAEVNQRDLLGGFTALHRAARLAHLDGYLEIYEYLLSHGADPSILSDDVDPYLSPGRKLPVDLAAEDARPLLLALDAKYAEVPKAPEPHPDISCWWTLYDYGLDAVKKWPKEYKHPYPEQLKRDQEELSKRERKAQQRERRRQLLEQLRSGGPSAAASALLATPSSSLQPDPRVVFLFPGQGSQAVGMLQNAKGLPAVAKMLEAARQILGYDLLELCLNGPKEKLDDTVYSQPALYVGGLAAVEVLRAEDPLLVERCGAAAGLSLGEYSAMVFAGAMTFEDGLRVVQARSTAMAAAAALGAAHGMLSVVGLPDADVIKICDAVCAKMGAGTVCQLANYLFPQGRVVSGHVSALEEVQKLAVAANALKVQRLAVSGAFHTPLMQPAREKLMQALSAVQLSEPRIPLFSNVTAQPFPASASSMKELLGRQLVEPVQWEGTLRALLQAAGAAAGASPMQLIELGPGQQIKAMVKRMDSTAWKAFRVVNP